jgi:hypothetical protein
METPDSRTPFARAVCLTLALLAASCSDAAPAPTDSVDEDTFVGAFVELRRAAATASTDEAFARERERILDERDVTEARLERFIDEHADDAAYLSEVWERIDRTLRGELDADGSPVRDGPSDAGVDAGTDGGAS